MKARALIKGASFGPETVKVMGEAFDQAWAEIAAAYGVDPIAIENARLRLARAMITVASEGRHDVSDLKTGALQIMRQTGTESGSQP
jgi:hypothetical protein